jgi:hypothetical protein
MPRVVAWGRPIPAPPARPDRLRNAMGQPIEVVTKPSPQSGVVRYETNRWLTGMGHERYTSADEIVNNKTVDQLARRLFATGDVRTVHVSGSVVDVELIADTPGVAEKLADVVRGLHIHYPDGAAAAPPGDEVDTASPDAPVSA